MADKFAIADNILIIFDIITPSYSIHFRHISNSLFVCDYEIYCAINKFYCFPTLFYQIYSISMINSNDRDYISTLNVILHDSNHDHPAIYKMFTHKIESLVQQLSLLYRMYDADTSLRNYSVDCIIIVCLSLWLDPSFCIIKHFLMSWSWLLQPARYCIRVYPGTPRLCLQPHTPRGEVKRNPCHFYNVDHIFLLPIIRKQLTKILGCAP